MPMNQALSSCIPRKYVYAHDGDFIATFIIIFLSLVCIIVYQLRILGEQHCDNKISASPSEGLSRHFSLAEIESATNNFDNLLVIGRGGFGFVYKGFIDGGTITVAIKRLNSKSKQGATEFWTEIDMLSKLRHTHLVSLIGYCDEDQEMILVYEYMEHGTLADHLYKINNKDGTNFDFSWEQKLNICIGAARGLDYLHTGTRHGIIHRDVKTTNILLDNEWVAKVSDFGLCKFGTKNQSHVSTNVKGTFGYMDPEYFLTRRLTKKSDVYAFGVVLLEVLCGRPALDLSLSEERHSLALWAQHCIKEGKISELVDPNLQEQISSPCLKVFTEVAYKCLQNRRSDRPTMSDVVVSLEGALISQKDTKELSSVQNEEENEANNDDSDNETIIPSPLTPVQEHENMFATNKKLEGKLSKAFPWSFRFLNKKKKKDRLDGSSIRQPISVSVNVRSKKNWNTNALPFRKFSISIWSPTKNFNSNHKLARGSDEPYPTGQIMASSNLRVFTFSELKKSTRNFRPDTILGEGGFGKVYKGWLDKSTASNSGSGPVIAVKKLNSESLQGYEEWESEIHFLGRFSHPNLVKLLGYCWEDRELLLVYEFMEKGSFENHLFKRSVIVESLPWDIRIKILIGAARGLVFLHTSEKQVIFRDFKASNILLDSSYNAKISDFGLAKSGPSAFSSHVTTRVMGTYGYAAPEYVATGHLNVKSDVYGFGVVMVETLTALRAIDRTRPSGKENLTEWIKPYLHDKGKLKTIMDSKLEGRYPLKAALKIAYLALKCLAIEPKKRPEMEKVVETLETINA